MDHLALLSATALRKALSQREISPVDVAEACLHQVECLNPTLNSVVTLNEHLLDEAHDLANKPPDGLLYGLTVGIKDTTETRNLRTTWGSPTMDRNTPDRDALIVQRLRSEGALILGKTNTPTFAVGGSTWNPVFGYSRNPWNISLTPGGSTGGGAAALATGMVALADGSDLGGSLRLPAAFCGVVGLRPSPGLIPLYPTMNVWDTLSVAGGMGRTAADVALLLQATAGPTPSIPYDRPQAGRNFVAAVDRGPQTGLSLAWCADPTGLGIEDNVLQPCLDAIQLLRSGSLSIEEIRLDLSRGRAAFAALRGHHLLTVHMARMESARALGDDLHENLREALGRSALDLASADRVRHGLWEQFRTLFGRFDYLLTPCTPTDPFPVEDGYPRQINGRQLQTYYDWLAPMSVLSLTGLPVASVPCGLSAQGLPVGMQIAGQPNDEEGVLALASLVQEICPVGAPPNAY